MKENQGKFSKLFLVFAITLAVFSLAIVSGCVEDGENGEEAVFELSNLEASNQEITVGQELTITVDVENSGDASGEKTVELLVDNEAVDQETVSLDQGNSTSASFDVTFEETGEKEIKIGDLTTTIEVTSGTSTGEPSFDVSNLRASSTEVTAGEQVMVTVDVENSGDADGQKTLELEVDNEVLVQETVSLAQGDSTEASFELNFTETGEKQITIQDLSLTVVVQEQTQELQKSEHKFVEDLEASDPSDLIEVEPEYSLNQEIYTYLVIDGFEVSTESKVNWEAYVTVYGPDNEPIPGLDNYLLNDNETQVETDKNWEKVWVASNLWPSAEGWEPGEHTIEYRIVDEIGGKEKKFTETFEVISEGLYFEDTIVPEDEGIELVTEGEVNESIKQSLRTQKLNYSLSEGYLTASMNLEGEIPSAQELDSDKNILYLLNIDTTGNHESDYDMGYYIFGLENHSELRVYEGNTTLDETDSSYEVSSNNLEMSINISDLGDPEELSLNTLVYYESDTGMAYMEIPWQTYD